ncbi:MAG: hypothetical protein KF694_01835 [Mesorhizobium sp.]|nr:hypothetical protein [Mesorhizobium sp.]
MDGYDIGILVFLLGGIGLLLFPKLIDALYDLYNLDGGRQRRYEGFMANARDRGLSYRETMDEWELRTAFAKLRRIASDRVAADLENWLDILEDAVKEIAGEIGRTRPELVKPFYDMVAAVTYIDILYPPEAAMVGGLYRDIKWVDFDIDREAALRIL